MLNFIKNFRSDEDGAVTVDWVVLTAAMVGIAVTLVTSVSSSSATLKTGIVADMGTASAISPSSGG